MELPQPRVVRDGVVMFGQGGPPVMTYLSFKEATGKQSSVANLARRVRKLTVETWFVVISQLLHRLALDHAAMQDTVIATLPQDVRRRIEKFNGRRVVLAPERLHATLRAAILYAPRGEVVDDIDSVSEDIAMAILEADTLDPENSGPITRETTARFYRESQLRQAARDGGVPTLDLARAFRMYSELPRELANAPEIAHARLHETFEKAAGLPLDREIAIRSAILARLLTIDTALEPLAIRPATFSSTHIAPADIRRVLGSIATDVSTITDEIRRLNKLGEGTFHDLKPFSRWPLAEISNDLFVPTDPKLLIRRLVGDGIWWRIRLAYRNQPDAFNSAVGRLFETYLTELTMSAVPPTSSVVPEFEYQKGKLGPDLCLTSNDAVIVLEASAMRPNIEKTILSADFEAHARDLDAIVIDRVRRQLAPKARSVANGEIPIVGAQGLPVIPILVLIDGFPTGPGLNDEIRVAARKAGLGQRNIEDLFVLNASEWESLCGLAETTKIPPSTFLRHWKREAPDAELLEVINAQHGTIPIPAYANAAFERAASAWTASNFGEAQDEIGARSSLEVETE